MVDIIRVLDELERAAALVGQHPRKAPATEEAIRLKQRELNARLPDSYRAFLLVSDGWDWLGKPSTTPGPIVPIASVEPLAAADPHLLATSIGAPALGDETLGGRVYLLELSEKLEPHIDLDRLTYLSGFGS